MALLIRLRAAADKRRFLPFLVPAGRRLLLPFKAVIAVLSRSRSASNAAIIAAVSMLAPWWCFLDGHDCTRTLNG
jgi:hypothetical protein